jgi:hypothetical protein
MEGTDMAHLKLISRFGILLAGLLLAFGALAPASALADAGGSNLPLKGWLAGTSTYYPTTCATHILVTGHATHFGLLTLEQDACITHNATNTVYTIVSGTWTMTAANGDQLWGAITSGTGIRTDASHVTYHVDRVSTGGTGRFADASSISTVVMYVHTLSVEPGPPPIAHNELEGTLDGLLSW